MKYASDILLHFLDRAHRTDPSSQFEIFKRIVLDGLRFAKTDLGIGNVPGGTPPTLSVPVVCFTDIPLTLTQAHVDRYGSFAIGFRKRVVKRWGGNPVLYLVDGGNDCLRGQFASYVRGMIEHSLSVLNDPHASDDLKKEVRKWTWLIAMFKEMADAGPAADQEIVDSQDRYYFEREWRIPLSDKHKNCEYPFSKTVPIGTSDKCHCYIGFSAADLALVVVPNEETRKRVLDWFETPEAEPFIVSDAGKIRLPPIVVYDDAKEF
jgi:hypothetical protein